jgi:hypothetical protein
MADDVLLRLRGVTEWRTFLAGYDGRWRILLLCGERKTKAAEDIVDLLEKQDRTRTRRHNDDFVEKITYFVKEGTLWSRRDWTSCCVEVVDLVVDIETRDMSRCRRNTLQGLLQRNAESI